MNHFHLKKTEDIFNDFGKIMTNNRSWWKDEKFLKYTGEVIEIVFFFFGNNFLTDVFKN